MRNEKIIKEAKKHLKENPYDSLHGVKHHSLVWKNCQTIVKKEKLEEVDMDALKIAAWWHDVEREQEECNLLRKTMRNLGYDSGMIDKVIAIINSHSYNQKQASLEGKILFDADKLDYLSLLRLKQLLEASFPEERFNYYKNAWKKRIGLVKDNLHFETTKSIFSKRLKKFERFVRSEPRLSDMAEFMV